jgi:hypothetical protein
VKLRSPERIPGVTPKGKKLTVYVRDPETSEVKQIHFGDSNYRHNYSEKARQSYLARSAGITDGDGNLTKDDPLSPNYWSRRVLWGAK